MRFSSSSKTLSLISPQPTQILPSCPSTTVLDVAYVLSVKIAGMNLYHKPNLVGVGGTPSGAKVHIIGGGATALKFDNTAADTTTSTSGYSLQGFLTVEVANISAGLNGTRYIPLYSKP